MPIKKFDSRLFNKLNNDEKILKFLKSVDTAVPPAAIVLATGLSPSKVSQRLRQLLKYKVVRKFYRKLPLYTLRGDSNAK
jgi:DNA-binding Lrp family transcriptional regulator